MKVQPIILCAGFGTRLVDSIANDPSQAFLHLVDVPKPLLPLGGSSIAERWLDIFASITDLPCIVITNALYYNTYVKEFGQRRNAPLIHNDGAISNDTRLGAVADIELALGLVDADIYCVVAGDTLLADSVDVKALLDDFLRVQEGADALTVGYKMRHPEVECRLRGLLCTSQDGFVTRFVEKPRVPPAEAVLASAPLYFFRSSACKALREFLAQNRAEKAPISSYDAPGFLMAHLVRSGARIRCWEIPARIDIGSLEDYIHALDSLRKLVRKDEEVVIGRCWPRVGCLGNPSDGYRGACVSFPINFVDEAVPIEARVFVRGSGSKSITIIPNRDRDGLSFRGWGEITRKIQEEGFYGGIRLIQAALVKFIEIVSRGRNEPWAPDEGVIVGYSSNIPFSVGLAG